MGVSCSDAGAQPATAKAPAGVSLDLTNTQPLLIGFGAQNYFTGSIADVRLYGTALTDAQAAALAGA